jgi:flagellar basal-body rod modification protein FlgD
MNPITPAATTTTTTTSSSSKPAVPGGDILSKDSFLKLMMTQLQNQDPLSPSDPTQYMNELAQLTTLEQTTNMAQSTADAAAEQHTTAALALLGHTVSYKDASGNTQTGKVDKVSFTSSGPMLTVAGVAGIDPAKVDEVS